MVICAGMNMELRQALREIILDRQQMELEGSTPRDLVIEPYEKNDVHFYYSFLNYLSGEISFWEADPLSVDFFFYAQYNQQIHYNMFNANNNE